MTNTPDTSPEAVERLALTHAQFEIAVDSAGYALPMRAKTHAKTSATLRALSVALEAERNRVCGLQLAHNQMAAETAAHKARAEAAEDALGNGSFYQEKDIDALQADRETLYKSGICEIAARNPSVMEYMRHWEARTEAAEAEIARMRDKNELQRKIISAVAGAVAKWPRHHKETDT